MSPKKCCKNTIVLVFLLLFSASLLTNCGDDIPEDPPGWPGYIEGPNEGTGWVGFTYPDGPVIETTDASIEAGGTTFIPADASCPGWVGDLGPNYNVTWHNSLNERDGITDFELNCATIVFAWWKAPYGMIPLDIGENIITITASDGQGNIGRASMTVIRN